MLKLIAESLYLTQALIPNHCLLVIVRKFVLLFSGKSLNFVFPWHVAMVSLVINHNQTLTLHLSAKHTGNHSRESFYILLLYHLLCLCIPDEFTVHRTGFLARIHLWLKLMIICYDYAGVNAFKKSLVIVRDKIAQMIVVRFIIDILSAFINTQYPQTITNGNAWSNEKEEIGKACVLVIFFLVYVVVKNEHRHNDRLARTCCHFEGCTWKYIVEIVTYRTLSFFQLTQYMSAHIRVTFSHLIEIYSSLNGFTLAEEKFLLVMAFWIAEPEIEQFAGYSCNVRIVLLAPFLHLFTNCIDKTRIGIIIVIILIIKK